MCLNEYSVVLTYFLEGEQIQWEKQIWATSEDIARRRITLDYGSKFSITSISKK